MISASASTTATVTTLGNEIKVTPAVSNGTITPYTFTNVTVPVKNDNAVIYATGALDNNDANGAIVATGSSGLIAVATGYSQIKVYSDISDDSSNGDAVVVSVSGHTG